MSVLFRCVVLGLLVMLSGACNDGPTTAPTPMAGGPTVPPEPAPIPPPDFPAVSAPARIYVATAYVRFANRYVLYDDRTFALQYSGQGRFFEYRGTYQEADGVITFAWSDASDWSATALLTEESLTVRYNVAMQFADFEDGVYLRPQ